MPHRLEQVFAKDFLWGAATSAHQVEGGLHNQWSVWELENAKALATQAPYQYSDLEGWPEIKKQARLPSNYVSGKATGHQDLYASDFDILKKLNMNAFRFSVEWSFVQPAQDTWNTEAIAYYRDYLTALKKRGIEPVVTMFHFTLPVWFSQQGGFEKRANIKHFVTFVDRFFDELAVPVRYVITLNEPEVYAAQSYLEGRWPPQVVNRLTMWRVLRNLARAHREVASILHAKNRRYKVSIAKNSSYIHPGDDAWLSVRSAAIMQYLYDDYFLKRVVKSCDFIGVNYYFSDRIYGYRIHNPDERVSDVGWDMQPENIQFVLERLSEKYKKPIMITENGLADGDDVDRKWWIAQTIIAMQQATNNGVQLLGYLHWSLLDNFEWDKGFWPKFGLVAVDRQTMRRTVRPSAVWFGKVIKKLQGGR